MSTQSIIIEGIPAAVTREQVAAALRTLGLDPDQVVGFASDATTEVLHIEVYADGRPAEPGCWRWTHDGKEMATHRLTIPVIEESPK